MLAPSRDANRLAGCEPQVLRTAYPRYGALLHAGDFVTKPRRSYAPDEMDEDLVLTPDVDDDEFHQVFHSGVPLTTVLLLGSATHMSPATRSTAIDHEVDHAGLLAPAREEPAKLRECLHGLRRAAERNGRRGERPGRVIERRARRSEQIEILGRAVAEVEARQCRAPGEEEPLLSLEERDEQVGEDFLPGFSVPVSEFLPA